MFLLSLHRVPPQCPWREFIQESLPQPRKVFVSVQLPLLKVLPLTFPVGVSLPQPLPFLLAIQVHVRRRAGDGGRGGGPEPAHISAVCPSAGPEADPGRRGAALAPGPDPTHAHLPRGGTIASLAAPPLRTSRQHLLHLMLD